jgi:hypothetical protein
MAPQRDLEIASLRQAVAMADAKEANGYYVGYAAWDTYIARLRMLEHADQKTRDPEMQANAWTYECLAGYRSSAAGYLGQIAGDLPQGARQSLMRAADLYNEMANNVLCDKVHRVGDIAPHPWMLKPGEKWTTAQMEEQVRRLETAEPLERQALDQIQQALSIIDKQQARK